MWLMEQGMERVKLKDAILHRQSITEVSSRQILWWFGSLPEEMRFKSASRMATAPGASTFIRQLRAGTLMNSDLDGSSTEPRPQPSHIHAEETLVLGSDLHTESCYYRKCHHLSPVSVRLPVIRFKSSYKMKFSSLTAAGSFGCRITADEHL